MESQADYERALDEAVQWHRLGRLEEAESRYRRAMATGMGNPDALQLLGVLLAQRGRVEEGVGMIRRATALAPGKAGYHSNLGFVLAMNGRAGEAVGAFERAVALDPIDPDARVNLARALSGVGRLEEAVVEYRTGFAGKPPGAEALNALGDLLHQLKRTSEAADVFAAALRLRPETGGLLEKVISMFAGEGRGADAEGLLREVTALRPAWGLACFLLGNLLYGQGRYAEAIEAYEKSLAIEPSGAARHNLASALCGAKRFREAVEQYRILAASGHDGYDLRKHIGQALWDTGELGEAATWFRRALELKSDPALESCLIYTMQFLPETRPDAMRDALASWNRRYVQPLASAIKPHLNEASPAKRLRVGYVARHLGNHPTGRFQLQLVRNHDRSNVEVYCYCDDGTDPIGQKLRESVNVWRETAGVGDAELAGRIRADGIDILVDLMMHVATNRLMTFALKPAPVQVTYLAYPGSTGLETMDYRLSDPHLDPIGDEVEAKYVENTIRLPATFWCYLEPEEAPPVGPLPADAGGGVTFGALNNDNKFNDHVASAWGKVLAEVPGSRLVLFAQERERRERVAGLLMRHGVEAARVRYVGWQRLEDYFAEYNSIDIALDTFPYPGGTTTIDALYMGVPVVSVGGKTPLSRSGVSILTNVGLESLIVSDVDQYVKRAVGLARNPGEVRELRSTLRDRLRRSKVMDGASFARDMEDAYRVMWRKWCDSSK